MKREQRKEKIRRLQREKVLELMTQHNCHQAQIARIMNLTKPTVRKLQLELGLPPRFPIVRSTPTRPYRTNLLAKKLVDEAVERFFGGQLPQDTNQLAKIMTNFPESVPDKLKGKMNEEQWQQYRAHVATGIEAAIRARENRVHVN
jgi:hypothetical protein